MTKVSDVLAVAESLWPAGGADEWDRPGLIAGALSQEVKKVLLSVDVTSELLDDAISGGFDLIISHHPFLLRGVTSLAENEAKGHVLAKAIRAEISLFAAHTNADITDTGVSATLAKAIGLVNASPLVATREGNGHGRIGSLAAPLTLVDFARQLANVLPATAGGIKVSGPANTTVQTVALCAGAGDSFISAAIASGADVYVTSDLRHHPTQDAIESASAKGSTFALVDISHWAAESLWLEVAANELRKAFPSVKFEVSDLRTDPWDFVVTQ
jgi:dinuclear metal center YbgI/SA1388 family protein